MLDVQVIDDPAAAALAVEPVKSQLLAALAEPASAAALAARLGLARQKVNYHLRSLEDHGLVHVAEERRWGGLKERLMLASATSYVVSSAQVITGAAKDSFNDFGQPEAVNSQPLAQSEYEQCGRSLSITLPPKSVVMVRLTPQ